MIALGDTADPEQMIIDIPKINHMLGPDIRGWDFAIDNIRFNEPSHMPEPGTWVLLGTGLAALVARRRRAARARSDQALGTGHSALGTSVC